MDRQIRLQRLNARTQSGRSSINDINKILAPNTASIQTKRLTKSGSDIALLRLEAQKQKGLPSYVMDFVGTAGKIYVTFGGTGDLILLLAEACLDPSAKVVWFANSQSKDFGKKFLSLFGLENYVADNIMGTGQANGIVDMIKATGRLAPSAHLADGLDYEDWRRNNEKYRNKLTIHANWVQKYGKHPDFNNNRTIILCPSGSVKTSSRQRFLEAEEYEAIKNIYLQKDFTVVTTGSEIDYKTYYKLDNTKNSFWLDSERLIDSYGNVKKINFKDFIQIINSAVEVVSMDTYLKTYTALCGIRTKVLDNRHYGKYVDNADTSDYIFLNLDLWSSMTVHKIHEFIDKNAFI